MVASASQFRQRNCSGTAWTVGELDRGCRQRVVGIHLSWWRHQIETFSTLLALCAGNSPVTCQFPSQRPVARSFGVFFYLCPNKRFMNKRLSKQSWGWWFEKPSHPLWRHCNVNLLDTSPVQPLVGLHSGYPIFNSSHCNLYGYAPVIRLKMAISGRHAHIHADKTDISRLSDS